MDIRDDHPEGLGTIPTFRQPSSRQLDPPTTGDDPTPVTAIPDPESASPNGLFGRTDPRPVTAETPTRTSDSTGSAPKPSTKDVTRLAAGLLGLAVVGVAALVRLRRGVQLRRPTDVELDDVAAPVARILMRHVPAALLHADLADVAMAGAAVGAYLNNGPLIEAVYVDPGVPDDLQEDLS